MPSHKSKGANLSDFDKAALKANILNQFPTLSGFEDEIEFMINEYSKDKSYIKRLAEKAEPAESLVKETKENYGGEIKHIKPDDPEYTRIMNALEKAKREHEERIEKGYQEEQRAKQNSKESNIDNVSIQS